MDEKQALDILIQGVNIGVGSGAFKNTKDVAIINQSIEILSKYFVASEEGTKMEVKK